MNTKCHMSWQDDLPHSWEIFENLKLAQCDGTGAAGRTGREQRVAFHLHSVTSSSPALEDAWDMIRSWRECRTSQTGLLIQRFREWHDYISPENASKGKCNLPQRKREWFSTALSGTTKSGVGWGGGAYWSCSHHCIINSHLIQLRWSWIVCVPRVAFIGHLREHEIYRLGHHPTRGMDPHYN